ncbi:MAG: hypothetical protein JNM43_20600, partial [Planctomycetaceae bacterium]|nr:hypothetical protein [Planctomycetaceae bacterium]
MSTVLKNTNGTKRTSGPASVQSFSQADRASTQVTRQIDSLVIQLRRQLWLKGGSLLVAVAAITLLTLTVADAVLQPQSFAARVSLWIIGSLLCMEAVRRFLFTPLRRDCDRLQLAWTLEQRHPEIEERLTSTLQLATHEDQRRSVFVEAIAGQAQAGIANCSDDALAGRSLRRAFLVAAFGFMLLVMALLVSPNRLLPSLANVLRPWHERVLPRLDAVILPGNTAVAEGSSVNIQVRGQQLDNAIVEFFTDGPQPVAHTMVPAANGTEAAFLLADVKNPLKYRIRSNGLYSEKFQINVHPAPVIQQLSVSAQLPEYTQINTVEIDHLEGQNPVGRITAVHGTLITLSAKTPVKITNSELSLDGKVSPGKLLENPTGDGGSVAEWTFPVVGVEAPANPDIRRGSVILVSKHGVRSHAVDFEILVTRDLPPLVEISLPGPGQLTVKPDQQLTLPYRAADDYGIQSLEVVTKVGTQEPTVSAIADLVPGKQMEGETSLDLKPHNLKPGDVLTVWLRATDNRGAGMDPNSGSGGPQSTDSKPLYLQVANDALPPGQQSVQAERDFVQSGIDEAINNLKAAIEKTEEYSKSLKPQEAKQDEQAQARKSSNEIREQIKSAQKTLERIDDDTKTKADPLFQPEAQQLSEVSQRELREADQQASLIPLSDKKDDRHNAAEETKQQLENALQKLNDVRESVSRRSRDMERAAQLDDLAKRQDQLAKELKEPKKDTEKDARKQKDVADQLQKLANDDEQTRSELFRQRSEKAEQLAKEAEQLKQQQEQLAQMNKKQAVKENRPEEAAAKLQEQIAERTEQLRKKADDLLQLPSEDAQNQQAMKNAQEKLKQASDDTNAAKEAMNEQKQA